MVAALTGVAALMRLSARIEFDEETRLYVGTVPDLPGAPTQAVRLGELRAILKEVLELCLASTDDFVRPLDRDRSAARSSAAFPELQLLFRQGSQNSRPDDARPFIEPKPRRRSA